MSVELNTHKFLTKYKNNTNFDNTVFSYFIRSGFLSLKVRVLNKSFPVDSEAVQLAEAYETAFFKTVGL